MQEEIAQYIAAETGQTYVSDWLLVDQAMLDQFADATRDWNFLHVDPEAAGATEFGGDDCARLSGALAARTVAQRNTAQAFPAFAVGVNYGIEHLRWVQPVRSGSRIRGHFKVAAITATAPGRYREELDVTVECEGLDRPAMVARWLTMYMT